jgi:hypothetical protein
MTLTLISGPLGIGSRTGVPQELNGLVRVDGKVYRYLGDTDRQIPALEETRREITPTRTIVTLQNSEIELSVTFLTPALPDDLKIMARPIANRSSGC